MAAEERSETVALNDDNEVSLGSLGSGASKSTLLSIRGVSDSATDVTLLIRRRTDPGPVYVDIAKRVVLAGGDVEIGLPVGVIDDAADSFVATLGAGELGTFKLDLSWLDRS